MKINSSDRCSHCGHWAGDEEPKNRFRIYSEARAKWLEKAAKLAFEAQGDDDWLDWVEDGKALEKKGQ